MGGAESMSERRPGVPRLRHGVGVGVGHVRAEGTVHGPIVSCEKCSQNNTPHKHNVLRCGPQTQRVEGLWGSRPPDGKEAQAAGSAEQPAGGSS